MHIDKLLHKVFKPASQDIDKRLHRALLKTAETLCECRHLSIAGLGRCLISSTTVKHSIKRIDRLFGNQHLHHKRHRYYKNMVNLLVGENRQPVILIDWSGLTHCDEYHLLRASIPVGRRALVIWESAYREKQYNSQKTHRTFIRDLKALLPASSCPIIVTDAGFKCPWYQLIREQGWEFIGRVRNRTLCRETGEKSWLPVKGYYAKATRSARYLFAGLLARDNPVACHFYLYHGTKQHRVKKNLRGKRIQSGHSLKYEKREREPWLIVSSLATQTYTPKQIISLYKQRMQIEEAFRDIKNTRNGFGLRHCRSRESKRLNVALLIGAIAMLLLWIVGIIVRQQEQHYQFQANTVRQRSVLSTFTIGWQSLTRTRHYCLDAFIRALDEIQRVAKQPCVA